MPIPAGLLSSAFGTVFAYLSLRVSAGFAAAAAFVLTSSAAYVAVKSALLALAAAITAVLPPTSYALLSYCVPGNLGACITAILIGDAIATGWDQWRLVLGTSIGLARG